MKELHLNRLKEGLPGITAAVGTYLAEAAAYCLDAQGHQSGSVLKVVGNFEEEFILIWTDIIDDQVKRAWGDQNEATEYAATAIAILLILELTNFLIGQRSNQTDRTDYYLIDSNQSYSAPPKAILEISGIFKETPSNSINMRLRTKKKNIDKISNRQETAYIVIVEFQIPKAKISIYE